MSGGNTLEPTDLTPATRAQLRSARRLLQRKERARRGEFLGEGPQAVREALARPGVVTRLFLTRAAAVAHSDLAAAALGQAVPVVTVEDGELGLLAETVTPQGLIAVCVRPQPALAGVLAEGPRLLVCCAAVRDPGNAGTVIRCADAFGADAVLFTADSVDATNPKAVRASAGSLFHLPVVADLALADAVAAARTAGLQVLAADGRGTDLPDLAGRGVLARPTLWVFGNEAWGLPDADLTLVDGVVRVPIYGAAESLNLGAAAAVCLYASATAQRGSPPGAANQLAPPPGPFLH